MERIHNLAKEKGQKIGYKYEDFVVTIGIGHRAGFAPKSTRENRQVRDTRRAHDETHALRRRQGVNNKRHVAFRAL